MSQFVGLICGFAFPLCAMCFAMVSSQLQIDGTVTIGNIFTALAFLLGGLLAVAAVPRQIKSMGKWITEHEKWSKEQTKAFTDQISLLSQILAELKVLRQADTSRLEQLEERFNNHVENHRARGVGGTD